MYFSSGKYFKAALPQSKYAKAGGDGEQGGMVSPMPGKLVRILVGSGQKVAAGEALVVLEAMKMEHTLHAAADAVVAAVHGQPGDVVPQKALLVSFEKGE